jgi:cyclopropane fatty-acyl-phospholipid synthase-like methyltransferase
MSMHAHNLEDAIPRYDEPLAPAWDVGRPQRALYELEVAGMIGKEVVDVGCGTGEHALWLARRGHVAWGVDPSAQAIARAQRRARKEGLAVELVVEELLGLGRLRREFDCALDAGSFHRLAVGERAEYARALATIVKSGGSAYVLCFADREKGRGGPPRVTREELRAPFAREEWKVESVDESIIESRLFPGGAAAWLLTALRT